MCQAVGTAGAASSHGDVTQTRFWHSANFAILYRLAILGDAIFDNFAIFDRLRKSLIALCCCAHSMKTDFRFFKKRKRRQKQMKGDRRRFFYSSMV